MKLVNIQTASEQTGLSIIAIRKMVKAYELPYIKLGNPQARNGKYLFNMEKVNDALEKKMMDNYKI